MRIISGLVVYFVLVYLGNDLLGLLGIDLGEDYGISYLSGKTNFSVSGAVVSCIIGVLGAVALIMLDEDGMGVGIAAIYWMYSIYSDYSELSKVVGFIGFLIVTLDSIIMLLTLLGVSAMKDSIRKSLKQ